MIVRIPAIAVCVFFIADLGLAAPPADFLRFKRLHVQDELIGTEAFTMLTPVDWKPEGGIVWRLHPVKPAAVHMRISSPDGRSQLEILPNMPFVDGAREAAMAAAQMAGPQAVAMLSQRLAEGKLTFGNEVRRQVNGTAAFVRQFVLPRCRGDLRDVRISREEDMPKVAEAVAAGQAAEWGARKTVRAGRTRIEFSIGGQAYEEDILCVLLYVEIPQIRQTFWGTEHLLTFRAPKGQLDEQAKVFRTMTDSFRLDLRWYNKYVQLVASFIQAKMEEIRAVGEFSRRWAQMSDEISRDRQKSWEDRQTRDDEMNRRYSQYQRGIDEYRDGAGNRVELPAGYDHAWVSRGDEYIVTDIANFNPNVELRGTWTQLEKVR